MELHTKAKKIGAAQTVYDDFNECPVDCDFVLPDYLPDIAAILKCILKPTVQSHQISGDRVIADGIATLQVLYLDEDRACVRSFEVTQPFSTAFTVKAMDSSYGITLCAKVNYVNCRATGPRHLDIHGAFSVKLTVQGSGEDVVICGADSNELCVKETEICYSVPTAVAEKSFTINEVLELEQGTAEMILRTETALRVEDCRQMAGKAIVKGELILKTVFVQDTVGGGMGASCHTIPFSQIVDADGMGEEDICTCKATVLLCEVHPTHNPNGESKLLSVTVKLCLSLWAYRTECSPVITDAYHTRYPLKLTGKRLPLTCLKATVNQTHAVRESVQLPDTDVQEIVDLWCDGASALCECEEALVNVQGSLTVCMIVKDSQGVLSYYERPLSFTLPVNEACHRMIADLSVLKTAWSRNGTTVELQLEVALCGQCYACADSYAITELTPDEAAPYTRPEPLKRCSVKAYFAAAGESVWEIAKAQHTSVHALCGENNLEAEVLPEDTLLLIPLC